MRNFPGKHTHEQVFNHQCHVYLNLELTHLKDPDTTYFDPNVNVDAEGIISRENMTNYDHDEFTDWNFLLGLTFDSGSNYQACKKLYPERISQCSAPYVLHRHSRAVKVTCKDPRCLYIIVLFNRAKNFTTHILNNKSDEDLFREIQLQSGRAKPITVRKYFAIRWDAQETLLEKLVVLRHNIITLLGHKKYTGPKELTPSNLEALKVMHELLTPSNSLQTHATSKKERALTTTG